MVFLTPLAGLVAVAVVVPLAAYALLERRARRVSRNLRLTPPALRTRLGVPVAITLVAALLGVAAAQPVVSGSRTRVGRDDAEVYLLFDTSRSMLARRSFGSPDRLARAKELALALRQSVADVPVGIASLTDRVLPHLFPTLDAQVFVSTLRESVGIEQPPPSGTGDLATDFNSFASVAVNNYFRPQISKRLVVIFSDGESSSFDDLVLGQALRRYHVHVLFVHIWNAREKIYLRQDAPDPAYAPDPASRGEAERVARDGGGTVVGEDPAALAREAKAFLGNGPETKVREQRTRISLGPYVALAALLPLSFVLLRRNL
jgi:hypothetical protein